MKLTDAEIQTRFAKHILDVEARRDAQGRLIVYQLPPGDGGGRFEVAGINERWHRPMAEKLAALIRSGRPDEAEVVATNYLENYTNAVNEWHPDEVVEGYLRSICFNRGPGGAAWVLQYALKFGYYPSLYRAKLDKIVGPRTRAAAALADSEILLPALYGARIRYENLPIDGKGSRDEDSPFWHGLFRRFTNDLVFALSLRTLEVEDHGSTNS